MAPVIAPVETSVGLPASTAVVVIGGGIVGLSAALRLAEQGIPVTVLEKGRIGAEQSSRNLGWVRKTNRSAADVPLALAAERIWESLPHKSGMDVGFRRAGIMFLARTEAEQAAQERWLASVADLGLDSRMLSAPEIDALVPGGRGTWRAGLFTASDCRAEPTLACSAIARAAQARGAVIVEGCAVRGLIRKGGAVAGVMTEHGEMACDQVILAGGMGSRRFLGNIGIALPTLPVICSVLRTAPMQGPTDIAVGAADFSFRKHHRGGYIVTQRGRLDAPLTPDHLRIGLRYLSLLRAERGALKIGLGREFLRALAEPRHWSHSDISPFERRRITDPTTNTTLLDEAMRNARASWPVFANAQIEETWAGMIDVTPDSEPVISPVATIPGLTLATGFSGHGFGTGPAAGYLAADLATAAPVPLVPPGVYRFDRPTLS